MRWEYHVMVNCSDEGEGNLWVPISSSAMKSMTADKTALYGIWPVYSAGSTITISTISR